MTGEDAETVPSFPQRASVEVVAEPPAKHERILRKPLNQAGLILPAGSKVLLRQDQIERLEKRGVV